MKEGITDLGQKEHISKIFEDFKNAFLNKIDKSYHISLQYEIIGPEETTVVQLKIYEGTVELYYEAVIPVEDILVMSYETLLKLYHQELTMATAMSCSVSDAGEMKHLIEPKYRDENKIIYHNEKDSKEALSFAKRMHKMDEFFNKDKIYQARIDTKFCGKAHGVNAICMLNDFDKGVLHAYFEINDGEVLDEPALPFSLYVLCGNGSIQVGKETIPIVSNTYYHINPTTNVKIMNKQDVCLKVLFLVN